MGPTATGAFCSLVKLGGQIYTAVTSPVVLLIVLGVAGRRRGRALDPLALAPPGPAHPDARGGPGAAHGMDALPATYATLIALGAMFVPAAILESTFQDLILDLTGLDSLVDTAGRSSLVSAATTLLVVGAGHAVAAALVLGARRSPWPPWTAATNSACATPTACWAIARGRSSARSASRHSSRWGSR